MSEYNTEDKISKEFDPDTMVGLSEWYYSEAVNQDINMYYNLKYIDMDIWWSATS
jgi:hypothetical protein